MTAGQDAATEGGPLQAIDSFHLVTADLPRLVAFYHEVLGFALDGPPQGIEEAEMALLAIPGSGTRQTLSIGEQRVVIEQFEMKGRPYPTDSDAASLWFQHLALVVVDIAAAYARLHDAVPISIGGPQQLPATSGGVKAFKFRDPDGHPLELLQFPADGMPGAWKGRLPLPGQIALGIDHSAISVSNPAASMRFYQKLGLSTGPSTLNHGPAQEALDGIASVRVDVVPMRPGTGTPHLELLGYQVPSGRSGPPLRPNDVAATRIVWRGAAPRLFADPDGHFQQVKA